MTTVDEYQTYARDCLRWAAKAQSEEQRKQLLRLARDWTQAAEALDARPVPSDLDFALARAARSMG
jgi:hypothetical protein